MNLKLKCYFSYPNKTPHDLEELLSDYGIICLQMHKKDHAVLMFANKDDLFLIRASW
ncbi:hypothetical protein Amal_01741 [Acetobacter malorum]|uniref:Uncharacterized protein n=1 Tax=Acetobacter malorum TaxID=178901 RepID=A0A177G852_9PROT|nr:hypothetical protein Amal_01741 [Acetobacter malorum]